MCIRDRKITAIFQPHLYTRTRDFYKDFADSLSLLDEVILTEIYPAREQPIDVYKRQALRYTSARRLSFVRILKWKIRGKALK